MGWINRDHESCLIERCKLRDADKVPAGQFGLFHGSPRISFINTLTKS